MLGQYVEKDKYLYKEVFCKYASIYATEVIQQTRLYIYHHMAEYNKLVILTEYSQSSKLTKPPKGQLSIKDLSENLYHCYTILRNGSC